MESNSSESPDAGSSLTRATLVIAEEWRPATALARQYGLYGLIKNDKGLTHAVLSTHFNAVQLSLLLHRSPKERCWVTGAGAEQTGDDRRQGHISYNTTATATV